MPPPRPRPLDTLLVLGMAVGEVGQGPARLLLHVRVLGVASHCCDHGSNPPLRACVCVCDCLLRHFFFCARVRTTYTHMHSCMFSTCAPILAWFSGWLVAMFTRAPHAFFCTSGFSAWRPIAVTTAPMPPCVCVCACVRVCVFAIAYCDIYSSAPV